MAEVQTSTMDAKSAPVSLALSVVNFGNHGNQIIIVWQLKPLSSSCRAKGDVNEDLYAYSPT
jgi:hypothetical protein